MNARSRETMRRPAGLDDGLTVGQLVISLGVLLLLGGIWMAISNQQRSSQPQSSLIALPRLIG
jgi:hypothetical protein